MLKIITGVLLSVPSLALNVPYTCTLDWLPKPQSKWFNDFTTFLQTTADPWAPIEWVDTSCICPDGEVLDPAPITHADTPCGTIPTDIQYLVQLQSIPTTPGQCYGAVILNHPLLGADVLDTIVADCCVPGTREEAPPTPAYEEPTNELCCEPFVQTCQKYTKEGKFSQPFPVCLGLDDPREATLGCCGLEGGQQTVPDWHGVNTFDLANGEELTAVHCCIEQDRTARANRLLLNLTCDHWMLNTANAIYGSDQEEHYFPWDSYQCTGDMVFQPQTNDELCATANFNAGDACCCQTTAAFTPTCRYMTPSYPNFDLFPCEVGTVPDSRYPFEIDTYPYRVVPSQEVCCQNEYLYCGGGPGSTGVHGQQVPYECPVGWGFNQRNYALAPPSDENCCVEEFTPSCFQVSGEGIGAFKCPAGMAEVQGFKSIVGAPTEELCCTDAGLHCGNAAGQMTCADVPCETHDYWKYRLTLNPDRATMPVSSTPSDLESIFTMCCKPAIKICVGGGGCQVTSAPTSAPTQEPTSAPTQEPTSTSAPTQEPTSAAPTAPTDAAEEAGVEVASLTIAFLVALSDSAVAALEGLVCDEYSEASGVARTFFECEAQEQGGRRLLTVTYDVVVKATVSAATSISADPPSLSDYTAIATAVQEAAEEAGIPVPSEITAVEVVIEAPTAEEPTAATDFSVAPMLLPSVAVLFSSAAAALAL